MPSYDKPKLMKLLEQRHAAMLLRQDISQRHQAARTDLSRPRSALEKHAQAAGAHEHIERLLALPLAEAIELTQEEVTGYQRRGNDQRFTAGINFADWKAYLAGRARVERLAAEVVAQENQPRFAIIPKLLEAVQSWGFRDPVKEL